MNTTQIEEKLDKLTMKAKEVLNAGQYIKGQTLTTFRRRGFEKISCVKTDIPLPERKTEFSAGYDIAVIHPIVFELLKQGVSIEEAWAFVSQGNPSVIVWKKENEHSIVLPTGIKAYMQPNEYLSMAVRSSAGIKIGIRQANPTSIIDADYYNNAENEGHIKFAIHNSNIVFNKPIVTITGVYLCHI